MGMLEGKVAIVTGAARGSGQAIARRFVSEGATVVMADILDERGEAAAAELGARARYRHADVTEEETWRDLVAATVADLGRLHVLVNNAAILHLGSMRSTSVETYTRVFRVNELGTFLGIREAAEVMKEAGGGSIVNVSSIDGHYVAPGTGAYAASKFAVRGLTKVAALELGQFGIRVNCICPGAGNPEMVAEALPEELRAALAGNGDRRPVPVERTPPVGRHGTLDDVAATAAFLASDDSAFYTGADFVLDGGTSAGMNLGGLFG